MAALLNFIWGGRKSSNDEKESTPIADRRKDWGGKLVQTSSTRPVALLPKTELEYLLWGTRDQYAAGVKSVSLDNMYRGLNVAKTTVVKLGSEHKRDGFYHSTYQGKLLDHAGKYVRNPERISSGSNGVAMRVQLHEMVDALNSKNVVVKFPMVSLENDNEIIRGDAMDYEFLSGLQVNKLRKYVPNFVYTIGFFIINACVARIPQEPIVFSFGESDQNVCIKKYASLHKTNKSVYYADPVSSVVISQAVPMLILESVESETPWRYDPTRPPGTNAISFGNLLMGWDSLVPVHLKPIRDVLIMSHLCQILLALQTGLDEFGFTHNDLNMNNILATPVSVNERGQPELVWFNYSMNPFDEEEAVTYRLPTLFRLTIIDFSRAYTGLNKLNKQQIKTLSEKYGLDNRLFKDKEITTGWPYGVNPSKKSTVFDMVIALRLAFADIPDVYITDRMRTIITKVGTCDVDEPEAAGEYGCHEDTIDKLNEQKENAHNLTPEELAVIVYPGPKATKKKFPTNNPESMTRFIMGAYNNFVEAYGYTHKEAPEFDWGMNTENRGQIYGEKKIRAELSKMHNGTSSQAAIPTQVANVADLVRTQSSTLIPDDDPTMTILTEYYGSVNLQNDGCKVTGCKFPVYAHGLCGGHIAFANTMKEGRRKNAQRIINTAA